MSHPFHPIIYVRGFAGTQGEIEDTVADPYMGFNIGSAKTRQAWDGSLRKYFFESPLVRLIEEYDYRDVYSCGLDQVMDEQATEPVPYKSVVIYRYYEEASEDLGRGEVPKMEHFARGLGELILKLRARVTAGGVKVPAKDFRVYLVAHSMGGLVCRCFLQNGTLGQDPRIAEARQAVDKVVTYATPHNGIDLKLIGNVPGWATHNNLNDFNRERMAEYLGVQNQFQASGKDDVSFVKNFDPDRFFNLVGTNAHDYSVLKGLSRFGAGEMSDGLVRIENATTWGEKTVKDVVGNVVKKKVNSPRAFVHRSHSGYFGIVNSEEGYQNMVRFFFGNFRVDGVLEINKLTLPPKVLEEADNKLERIHCAYSIETVVSVRGVQWQMHRRTAQESSAVLIREPDEEDLPKVQGQPHLENGLVRHGPIRKHLFSAFLSQAKSKDAQTASGAVKKEAKRSVSFAVDLRVLVPEYEINNRIFADTHYEGGYIYRDRLYVAARPDPAKPTKWTIVAAWESEKPSPSEDDMKEVATTPTPDGGLSFEMPIKQTATPGLDALLRVTTQRWNR
jgi:hypothetical protein